MSIEYEKKEDISRGETNRYNKYIDNFTVKCDQCENIFTSKCESWIPAHGEHRDICSIIKRHLFRNYNYRHREGKFICGDCNKKNEEKFRNTWHRFSDIQPKGEGEYIICLKKKNSEGLSKKICRYYIKEGKKPYFLLNDKVTRKPVLFWRPLPNDPEKTFLGEI